MSMAAVRRSVCSCMLGQCQPVGLLDRDAVADVRHGSPAPEPVVFLEQRILELLLLGAGCSSGA